MLGSSELSRTARVRALIGLGVMGLVIGVMLPGAEAQTPDPEMGQQLEPPTLGDQPAEAPAPQQQMPTTEESVWEGMTVVDVQVAGNQRVEAQTILERVETAGGDVLDRAQITADIRNIHALGFFQDIQVEADEVDDNQVVITFVVAEQPAIDAVRYEGISSLSEEDVEEVVELQRFSILDPTVVTRSAEAIRDLYHDEGYFLAEVDYEITTRPDRDDLAVVTFQVQEYAQVEVKRVTFLGNEALSDDELQSVMATRPGNFLSFVTEMGQFSEEDFEEDLQRLTAFYYDHGYVAVQVQMPTIRLSPDKRYL